MVVVVVVVVSRYSILRAVGCAGGEKNHHLETRIPHCTSFHLHGTAALGSPGNHVQRRVVVA